MRIALFDIDGTLLMTNNGGKGALALAIAEEFQIERVCTEISFAGRTDRALLAELLKRNGLPADEIHLRRLRDRYIAALPAVLTRNGGQVLPGAAELLSRIAEHDGVVAYAMTGNLQETASRKLQHFDLLRFVRGIFGGDFDVHRDDLARRAASMLRRNHGSGSIRELVVIGDTPDDIRCARAIGARAIAVCTGHYRRDQLEAEQPQWILEDLSDVEQMFQLLTDP